MIKLDIFQQKAHYRIPTIGQPLLSYPIVPPSTIFGFLREITNKTSINFHNTQLAILGKSEGISFEVDWMILNKKSKSNRNIIKTQILRDVNTKIFIKSSQEIESKILSGLSNYKNALRLGRREDLILDFNYEKSTSKKNLSDFNTDYYYTYYNNNENSEGAMFRIPLDSTVDSAMNVIGYKFTNLIYAPLKEIVFIES